MVLMRDFLLANKIPLVLGASSVILLAIALSLLFKTSQPTASIEFSLESEEASVAGQQARLITIDIEGAVNQQGVYQLPEGSRIEDAIAAAGDLTNSADLDKISQTINRAAKLLDGGKLYFPKKGELTPASGISSEPRSAGVSINSASQSELEALSGIGPVTAGKIISNRPYQVLEELVTKKALSKSLFEKLKNQLTL